jgi:hypothetical protein
LLLLLLGAAAAAGRCCCCWALLLLLLLGWALLESQSREMRRCAVATMLATRGPCLDVCGQERERDRCGLADKSKARATAATTITTGVCARA